MLVTAFTSTFLPLFQPKTSSKMTSSEGPVLPTVPLHNRPASVYAADWEILKKCSDLGFARRQRHFSTGPEALYNVDPVSVRILSWNKHEAVVATLSSSNPTSPDLLLALIPYKPGICRVIIDDPVPLRHSRHVVSGVLEEKLTSLPLQDGMLTIQCDGAFLSMSDASKIWIQFHPFNLQLVDSNGQVFIGINLDGRLCVEDFTGNPGDDSIGPETFCSFTDSKPRGPESVGVDVSFPDSLQVYGLPERAMPFSLPDTLASNGTANTDPYRLYNLDIPGYVPDIPIGLYGSIPFLMGRKSANAVGIFWHNTSETYVDISTCKSGRKTHWFSESGIVDLFVLPGPTPCDVFTQYLSLTGTPAFQQRFVLGYHQCRFSYVDEKDVRSVDASFDKYKIPYDVMWLDIDHTDGKRYFTWDKNKFPDPSSLLDDLAAKGRKVVTIVDPHIKNDDSYDLNVRAKSEGSYVKNKDDTTFLGKCWPGESSYFDYTSSHARTMWSDQFSSEKYPHFSSMLHIWNDMNEPSVFDGPERTFQKDLLHSGNVEHRHVHNIYGHDMIRGTYSGVLSGHGGNLRPFVLTRSFFAGSQRYAAVWTGDNTADWDHLKKSVQMVLSLQICGVVLSGADIGGFFGNPNGELVTRWYQAAAFQPFFRGHSCTGTNRREPWLFGEPYTSHISDAIRTRYEFLPYWYTLLAACSIGQDRGFMTGDIAPLMRPVWWEFPASGEKTNEIQWLVGNALLIAPVLNSGTTRHIIDVPDRTIWYDLKHPSNPGCKLNKTGKVELSVDLGRMIVLQRGGTVVPKVEATGRSSEAGAGEKGLTVSLALNEAGFASGKVYIDDGRSYSYEKGEFALCEISIANGVLSTQIIDGKIETFGPSDGAVIGKVVVLGIENVKSVALDDSEVAFEQSVESNMVMVDNVRLNVGGAWRMTFKM